MRNKFIAITLVLFSSTCSAQTPNDFYTGNFARTPLENPGAWGAELPKPKIEIPKEEAPKKEEEPEHSPSVYEKLLREASERVNPDTTVAPQDLAEDDSAPSPLDSRPGTPIESIGAIIDGHDTKHFESSIKELIDLAVSHDLSIGKVFFVGPPVSQNITKTIGSIAFRGGSIEIRGKVPDEYPVKMSPTYIVGTKDGEILLEAVDSLDKFFNTKGEFVDPTLKQPPSPAGDQAP